MKRAAIIGGAAGAIAGSSTGSFMRLRGGGNLAVARGLAGAGIGAAGSAWAAKKNTDVRLKKRKKLEAKLNHEFYYDDDDD